jgi:hypothetical protein
VACYFCPLYVALGVFKVDAYAGVFSCRLDFVAVDYELAVGGYAVVYGVAFNVDEFVYPTGFWCLSPSRFLREEFTTEFHRGRTRSFTEERKAEFLHYRKRFKRRTSAFDLGVGSALG